MQLICVCLCVYEVLYICIHKMSWPRSGMVLDQILPIFGPNHHKGIRIWSGAGPVLVQIRKNGSMPVLARCAKRHRPESIMQIWSRTSDGSGPDLAQMIFAIWVIRIQRLKDHIVKVLDKLRESHLLPQGGKMHLPQALHESAHH